MKKLRAPTSGELSSVAAPPAAIALALMLAPEMGVDPTNLAIVLSAVASWLTSMWTKQEGREGK